MDINVVKTGLGWMKITPRYFASERSFKRKVKWLSKRAVTSIEGVVIEHRLATDMGLLFPKSGYLIGRDPVKDLVKYFEESPTPICVLLTTKDVAKALKVIGKSVNITDHFDITERAIVAIDRRKMRAVKNAFVKACFEDIVHKDIECSECDSSSIDDDTECRDCNTYRYVEYDEDHYTKTFKKGSGKLKRLA